MHTTKHEFVGTTLAKTRNCQLEKNRRICPCLTDWILVCRSLSRTVLAAVVEFSASQLQNCVRGFCEIESSSLENLRLKKKVLTVQNFAEAHGGNPVDLHDYGMLEVINGGKEIIQSEPKARIRIISMHHLITCCKAQVRETKSAQLSNHLTYLFRISC